VRTGDQIAVLEGHTQAVRAVDVSIEAGIIVSGARDGTARIWDPAAAIRQRSRRHDGPVWGLAQPYRGLLVASASMIYTLQPAVPVHAIGRNVMEWDPCDGASRATHHTNSIFAMTGFAGRYLLVSSTLGTPMAFDLKAGELKSLVTDTFSSGGFAVAGAPKQMLIAAAHDKDIDVWNVETQKRVLTLRGHQDVVTSLSMTVDLPLLASGSRDRTVKVWDLSTGAEVRTFSDHEEQVGSVLVTSNGYVVSGSGSGRVRMWRIEDGVEVVRRDGHTRNVTSLAFARTPARMISTSEDGSLVVWDLPDWTPISRFRADAQILSSLAVDDWNTIVAGDDGGTVHFLHVEKSPAWHADPAHMAGLWMEAGQYERALRQYKTAVRDVIYRSGDRHPDVAFMLNQLAFLLRKMGRPAEAERHLRRSIAIEQRSLPPVSPKHPHRLNNLCTVLVMQGKLAEAKRLCSEAWKLSAGRQDVTTARILFMRLVIAMLGAESIGLYIGQLKTLLTAALGNAGDVVSTWDIASFLNAVRPRLSSADVDFLQSLAGALNDRATIPALDPVSMWKDQPALPLDASWAG
jgi:hypothetical protein